MEIRRTIVFVNMVIMTMAKMKNVLFVMSHVLKVAMVKVMIIALKIYAKVNSSFNLILKNGHISVKNVIIPVYPAWK